jgi:hypothetical protein
VSGGSGGGGGAVASSPVTFSTKEINTKTIYQKSADNPIKLTNTGTTPITITISATDDLGLHDEVKRPYCVILIVFSHVKLKGTKGTDVLF